MTNDLDNFIKEADKRSQFLRFEEGEPVEGIYKGAKYVDDTFNLGEKVMQYSLEVDDIVKTFKSKSVVLARLIKPLKEGDTIEITKTGSSFNTKWYVKKLG